LYKALYDSDNLDVIGPENEEDFKAMLAEAAREGFLEDE
jgi:hypothetical protein